VATFIFSLKFKSSSFRSGVKRVFTHDAVYEFPRRPPLGNLVNKSWGLSDSTLPAGGYQAGI
jgi:hypothetical protein